MKKHFYKDLCRECGGEGLVEYEPVNHGGVSVTEQCGTCRGKHRGEWHRLVTLERMEKWGQTDA